MKQAMLALSLITLAPCVFGANADEAVFETRTLTPEAAMTAAKVAMEKCRKDGFQVSVAVVDRSGLVQVLIRDRFAGAHTIDAATNKAWTAISFKMPTAALGNETQAGKPMSGIRALPKVAAFGGGQVIESGGSYLAGIGVSGAPGGEADDACAHAGIKAIADALAF